MTNTFCNGLCIGMNLKMQRGTPLLLTRTTDKTMIQTYQILPVVAIVCSASAMAQNAVDPVELAKQNVDLISSANKVLDDVKDNTAVAIAIKQLDALTQEGQAIGQVHGKCEASLPNRLSGLPNLMEMSRIPSWTCWKIANAFRRTSS